MRNTFGQFVEEESELNKTPFSPFSVVITFGDIQLIYIDLLDKL